MADRPRTRSLTNADRSGRNHNEEEAQLEQQNEDHQETSTRADKETPVTAIELTEQQDQPAIEELAPLWKRKEREEKYPGRPILENWKVNALFLSSRTP